MQNSIYLGLFRFLFRVSQKALLPLLTQTSRSGYWRVINKRLPSTLVTHWSCLIFQYLTTVAFSAKTRPLVKALVDMLLVITKGYGVRAATIEGQNSWWKRFWTSAALCVSVMWQMAKKKTGDKITSDRRSKRAWSKRVLCIPYILGGGPNECWLHTCHACVITTWRLGLRAIRGARN